MVAEGGANPTLGEAGHGVSFEDWAFVLAGVGDGLTEEELLAHLGLDEERWQRANAAFHEDLLDDVEAGGTLTEAFDEAMRAARKRWSREIPPLDVDLRAWIDFQRAWVGAESPMEFLGAHGLRATDVHRLEDHWQEKLAADEGLRNDALAIRRTPPGPVPTPMPQRPRLPSVVASADGAEVTGPAMARSRAAPLPFAEGAAASARPKLSVSLPTTMRATRHHAGETRVAVRADAGGLVLPFLAPEERVEEPAPSLVGADEAPDDGERLPLAIDRYAALCVDLIAAPDAHEAVLRRYGITPAEKLALDVLWTQKMAEDPMTWLAWDRATAQHRARERDSEG